MMLKNILNWAKNHKYAKSARIATTTHDVIGSSFHTDLRERINAYRYIFYLS